MGRKSRHLDVRLPATLLGLNMLDMFVFINYLGVRVCDRSTPLQICEGPSENLKLHLDEEASHLYQMISCTEEFFTAEQLQNSAHSARYFDLDCELFSFFHSIDLILNLSMGRQPQGSGQDPLFFDGKASQEGHQPRSS